MKVNGKEYPIYYGHVWNHQPIYVNPRTSPVQNDAGWGLQEATHALEIVDTMKGSKPSWDGQRESQMALEILIAHWGKQPQEASTNQKINGCLLRRVVKSCASC